MTIESQKVGMDAIPTLCEGLAISQGVHPSKHWGHHGMSTRSLLGKHPVCGEKMDSSLHHWIEQRRAAGTSPPSVSDIEFLIVMHRLSRAVLHMWEHRIVHRCSLIV